MKIRHWMVLALLAFAPAAFAVDGNTLVGGAIGAGAGAVIGHKLNGKNGAVAGAVIGGAVGAMIGSNRGSTRMMAPRAAGPGVGAAGAAAQVRGDDGYGYRRYEGDGDRGGYYRRHDRGHHYGERRHRGRDREDDD